MGLQRAVADWLDDRFQVGDAVEAELSRPIPNYAAAAYHYLGAVVVILIAVEFVSGFLLGLYYVPDGAGNPAPAYTSVGFIQHTAYRTGEHRFLLDPRDSLGTGFVLR